jgi:hypothetical protein
MVFLRVKGGVGVSLNAHLRELDDFFKGVHLGGPLRTIGQPANHLALRVCGGQVLL